MTRASHIIVGGGLAGGLAALALAEAGRGAGVVLVEAGAALGGNHTWSCHETDLDAETAPLVIPLVSHRWPRQSVRFPARERVLETGYLTVTGERFERLVRQRLAQAATTVRLGARVVELREDRVRLEGGLQLEAEVVIDARGPETDGLASAARGFQKFVGLELALEEDGPWEAPLVMDASVDQTDGFRFVYVLPFSRRHVLVEDTVYGDDARVDVSAFERRILEYVAAHGARVSRVLRREGGALPLPRDRPSVRSGALAIGYGGGFFHGVTGYSLPEAARVAHAISKARTRVETAAALAALTHASDRQRGFQRLLTRLLFGAMPAGARWTALERFYRLPDDTIARFYASRSTTLDQARMLLGRPPAGLSWRRLVGGAFAREAA